MSFAIMLTNDAARDLDDIYRYIAQYDTLEKAEYVLEKLEKTLYSLTENPYRGPYPPELLELGLREYREIFFKPYRIIYRIIKNAVYVLLIADGRRDMLSLLEQRLIQA